MSIHKHANHDESNTTNLVAYCCHKGKIVSRFDFEKNSSNELFQVKEHIKGIDVDSQTKYVAAIANNILYLYDIATGSSRTFSNKTTFTSLSFNPDSSFIATGDSKGQIKCWYSQADKSERVSIYHWHANPVRSINFTPDGGYMLSGGDEAVLVQWQLAKGKKDFLPRLGASIQAIAVSPCTTKYALVCNDNRIRIIDAAANCLERTLTGVLPGVTTRKIVVDPTNQSLVFTGTDSLQWFEPFTDRQLRSEVVKHRNVTFTGHQTVAVNSRIEHVCFSRDGKHMVTALQSMRFNAPTTELIFWTFDATSQRYVKNTSVVSPHATVSSLVYHPHKDICVSCSGSDNEFKVWTIMEQETRKSTRDSKPRPLVWACTAIGSFKEKSASIRDACFSPDGSLLTIAIDNSLTFWACDHESLTLLKTATPHGSHNIRTVKYLSDSVHLVVLTTEEAMVWSIMGWGLLWTLETQQGAQIVAAPASADEARNAKMNHFIVTSGDLKTALLFGPSSPVPIRMHRLASTSAKVESLAFLPPRGDTHQLVCLDSFSELHLIAMSSLGGYDSITTTLETISVAAERPKDATNQKQHLRSIFGTKKKEQHKTKPDAKLTTRASNPSIPNATREWMSLFDAPSHVIAPLRKTYQTYMDKFLITHTTPLSSSAANDKNNDIVAMLIKQQQEVEADNDWGMGKRSSTSQFTQQRSAAAAVGDSDDDDLIKQKSDAKQLLGEDILELVNAFAAQTF
eukprot:GEZU01027017.1.p1 GENE.GEZU01027017.1~~GEZU01027017.1.p1  ORF type:complete len:739 (+),score=128.73 GEZU01027017.1:281-2497(+)